MKNFSILHRKKLINQIIKKTTQCYDVPDVLIKTPAKYEPIISCKHIIRYLLYKIMKLTYKEIAEITGVKRHYGILHSIKNLDDPSNYYFIKLRKNYEVLKNQILKIYNEEKDKF